MHLTSILSVLGLAAFAMAQCKLCVIKKTLASHHTNSIGPDDAPCGSAKTCLQNCPNEDFFPLIDSCEIDDDGQPDCYVNFYCA